MLSAINNTPNEFETIAVVCHNPGITVFANMIKGLSIDNVPTCGVLMLKSDVNKWEEVCEKNLAFAFFDYPKNGL
jgi:phosphohistidine phosphatase